MTTVDYSAANYALWNPIAQMGIIAATILVANLLRRRFRFIRKSMMPTAVLGGLILLCIKVLFDKAFGITFWMGHSLRGSPITELPSDLSQCHFAFPSKRRSSR